jgi:serine/threonine-protein kinase
MRTLRGPSSLIVTPRGGAAFLLRSLAVLPLSRVARGPYVPSADLSARSLREECATTSPTHFLRLFGGIGLDANGESAAESLLTQPKIVALLAYLAVPAPGRFVRRDALVAMFWPELDQAHARAALRKAVHVSRAALGAGAIVARGDEEVALSADVMGCDAADFIRAADSGALARALELYTGDLMPGFHLTGCWDFDRWLEEERVAARERAAAATWAIAQLHENERDLTAAGTLARRSVRLSWSDERALRRALLMLDRIGDRAGALRMFEEFSKRLKTELDIEPSAETLTLISEMRQ